MRAYLFNGPEEMRFELVKEPRILSSTDAIVKVSYSSVCGMDVKIKKGLLPEVCPGTILGHEFCGIVVETGSSVKNFKTGDPVAVSAISSCGICEKCMSGESEKCINGGWLVGYSMDGCQAELTRVPFADRSLTLVPQNVSLLHAVFAGDIAVSGYQAAINGSIQKGDSVIVLGSGPAACVAMMCARKFEPAVIIAVDNYPKRLKKVVRAKIADLAIENSGKGTVREINRLLGGKMADCVIEATGMNEFFSTSVEMCKENGNVSVLSVYSKPLIFSMDIIGDRRLTLNTKRVEKDAVSKVLKLIDSKTIDAAFLCSELGSFEKIETGYELTDKREDGFLKWVCNHE